MQFCDFNGQHVTEAFLVVDAQGKISYASPVVYSMLGYENLTLQGHSIQMLCGTERPLPKDWRESDRHELIIAHHDGHEIGVTLTVMPVALPVDGDRLISVMETAELERMNNALLHTQRLAGVGTLTASVAHELTNPLSIITAICGNLLYEAQENNLDQKQLLRYIDLIEQSAFRSARIVEVLRNYAHLDGPEMAVTDVEMIVRDALMLVEQQFRKQANVNIEVNLPDTVRSVVCDHNRIIQVLVNLLINARDAMQPDGGRVYVKFWSLLVTNPDAAGNGKLPPAHLAFSVRDEGHGIRPEWLEKIFEPFFTTKPSGQGTGLGLYIARGIIDQHNGRIWAENNPEKGAIFTVVMPQMQ